MFAPRVPAIAACAVVVAVSASAVAGVSPTWTIAHDNPTGTQTTQLRAIALANTAGQSSIYTGFIQTSNNPPGRTVRRFDSQPAYGQLHELGPGTSQPKALATDDRGNVFVGYRLSGTSASEIHATNASMGTTFDVLNVGSPNVGGMGVHRVGNDYYAYVAYEGGGLVQRFNVTDPTNVVLDVGFGVGGSYTLPVGGGELRGVEVDSSGNLWVASRADGLIYRVSPDLSTVNSVAVPRAFDVAFFDGRAYVTSYNGAFSLIRVLDEATMSFIDDITISEIGFARGSAEGYSGIDIGDDGRIWLADQSYGTSPVRDRLLVSSPIPAPGTLSLLGLAGLVAVRRRR